MFVCGTRLFRTFFVFGFCFALVLFCFSSVFVLVCFVCVCTKPAEPKAEAIKEDSLEERCLDEKQRIFWLVDGALLGIFVFDLFRLFLNGYRFVFERLALIFVLFKLRCSFPSGFSVFD